MCFNAGQRGAAVDGLSRLHYPPSNLPLYYLSLLRNVYPMDRASPVLEDLGAFARREILRVAGGMQTALSVRTTRCFPCCLRR